jgi:hypothetical protein
VVAVVVRLMSGVYCGGCCSQVFLGDRFVVLCVTSGGCVCHRMTSKMMLGFVVIQCSTKASSLR